MWIAVLLGCQNSTSEAQSDTSSIVGLYSVPADACSLVAAAGFTVIHDYAFETRRWDVDSYVEAARTYLDAAHRWNLRVLLGVPRTWAVDRREDQLASAVRALAGHPALLAWYEEEMFLKGDLASVQFMDRVVNAHDPMNGFIIEESKQDPRLLPIGRERLFTWYPVTSKARRRGRLISVEDRFKPVPQTKAPWISLQIFGRDSIEGYEDPDFLLPTWHELQYCLYSGVISGSPAVFFYSYMQPTKYDVHLKERGKWPWVEYESISTTNPGLWMLTKRAVSEWKLLAALIREASNESLVVLPPKSTLRQRQWRTQNGWLMLVANASYTAETITTHVGSASRYRLLHASGWSPWFDIAGGTLIVEIPGPGGAAALFE